ncbi:hypothetical protein EG68_07801 [Paragonimus skrjabini miyazakii]|uniref:Autophagy protein 5 n=1 Tax=Paragonimus skrjabini miyazakii TaxID=59628 RepID=A0A8S9YKR8_9TREM|nr:hypothetical protein EG68_07801 [Paragonimus skrjabini miyazakii]
MGERKGTNKYYPPDFNPKIHKNLNAYHGTHALRERGKNADKGIIVIRFEMPFNCWCLTCKNPIGMGVRYNAQKTKVGMYHSTPIYKFTMPCHLCAGVIVMQTDPQNFDYIILEGARRKTQKWDPEDNEQLVIADAAEKKKLALDAMYHLEHDVKDKVKGTTAVVALQQLEHERQTLKDDFILNQIARKQFRDRKRLAVEAADKDHKLMSRLSLLGSDVHLLPEDEGDLHAAKMMRLTYTKRDAGPQSKNPSRLSVDDDVIFYSKKSADWTSVSNDESITRRRSSGPSTSNVVQFSDASGSNPCGPQPLTTTTVRSERMKQRSQAFQSISSTKALCSDTVKLLSGVCIRSEPLEGKRPTNSGNPKIDLVAYENIPRLFDLSDRTRFVLLSSFEVTVHDAVDIVAVIVITVMPDDFAEIPKRVWDAKIPVCFTLAQEELVSEDHVPSPFYMLVPRISYFPLVIDRVIRYFIDFTEFAELKCKKTGSEENKQTEIGVEAVDHLRSSPKLLSAEGQLTSVFSSLLPEHKVWLEYANQPLKWHYPIGLLFDLHADGTELPWKLVVHFNNYPTDVLLCPPVNRRAVELHFISVIKEADVLKHRSQVMNQMQARDQRQLWTGLLTHQFDQFWAINQRLMQPIVSNSGDAFSPSAGVDAVQPEQASGTFGDHCSGLMVNPSLSTESTFRQIKAFRNIPCRLYRASKFKGGTCAGYIQKRVRPYTSDGTSLTIGTVMRQFLSTETADSDGEHSSTAKDEEYRFLLHGICLPEDTPIQWLSEHMAYADNFMHIVAWSSSRFNQALEL